MDTKLRVLIPLSLIILRPHSDALGPQAAVYLADLALLAVLIVPVLISGKLRVPQSLRLILIVGILLLVVGWSLAIINLTRGVLFPDVLRFTLFGLYLVLLINYFELYDIDSKKIGPILDKFFWVVAAIAIIQLLNPPVLGVAVREIWGTTKLRDLWSGYPRIYSTFYNANWFGVYLVFMVTQWAGRTVHDRDLSANSVIKLATLAFMLFISGSRTGMIGLAVVLVLAFPWLMVAVWKSRYSHSFGLVTLILAITLVAGTQYIDVFGKLIDRYIMFQQFLLEGQADTSIDSRVSLWRIGVESFSQRPFLGYGAIPGGLLPHNSYLAIALSMGLPGFLLFIVFTFTLLIRALLAAVSRGIVEHLSFFLFSVSLAVMGLSGEYFYTSQVVTLWILALALTISGERHSCSTDLNQVTQDPALFHLVRSESQT